MVQIGGCGGIQMGGKKEIKEGTETGREEAEGEVGYEDGTRGPNSRSVMY
jgi:hypothetical protein